LSTCRSSALFEDIWIKKIYYNNFRKYWIIVFQYQIIPFISIRKKSGGKQPIFHTPEYLKQYMSKEILQWESEIRHSSRPHISGGDTKIPIKKITIFICVKIVCHWKLNMYCSAKYICTIFSSLWFSDKLIRAISF
jgi:hypothetical protein